MVGRVSALALPGSRRFYRGGSGSSQLLVERWLEASLAGSPGVVERFISDYPRTSTPAS